VSDSPDSVETTPLLAVDHVIKDFRSRGLLGGHSYVRAVDDVSFSLEEGEALGFVGESGCGKTTVGRLIVRLTEPTTGTVRYDGRDVFGFDRRQVATYRRQVQMIFQNSLNAFNPHRRVADMLADGIEIHRLVPRRQRRDRLVHLVEQVGLSAAHLDRYPQQLSGGQRQRIGIARALSVSPTLLVADEATSALDVSVQAQILNLFARLRRELGLALLFISHDLRAVYFLCERIAVLYLGRLVEVAPRRELIEEPAHPYTQALIASVPGLRAEGRLTRPIIQGELADAVPDSRGCVFAPRCPLRRALGKPASCTSERPTLRPLSPGRTVACHFAGSADSPGAPPRLSPDVALHTPASRVSQVSP
jgi:oligopeptide/dipeptide ABC transporter ATP-binding protein